MRPYPTRILLFLILCPFAVEGTNFTQCLIDFRNDTNAVGGVDYQGRPTNSSQAIGFTYETCTARCGSGPESFAWREFAQLFASWLLPWLALISQLPFGSGNYADDFFSVIMSVGSPALAAYSLVLTSLNARSVYRMAENCAHESAMVVANALIHLQQTSLELTKDPRLLTDILINHRWREEIAERLHPRNAWSVAAATSVLWVVISYLFTLVDSFVSLATDPVDEPSEGQAVGTIWLWLLCLVIGWLWVPTFTSSELKRAIGHANKQAMKKAAKKIKQGAGRATKAISFATNMVTTKITRIATDIKESKKPSIEAPPEEPEKGKEESIRETVREVTPVNPQPTVSYQAYPEGQRGHDHLTTSGNQGADPDVLPRSVARSPAHPERDGLLLRVHLGPLNRDERRVAATFNYSRVMRYRVLVGDVLEALEKLARDGGEDPVSEAAPTQPVKNPTFPPGTLISMFNASVISLVLQCGITTAATGIVFFTPTIGLGCRSMGYIIYGGISVYIMFSTIISTIAARIAETRGDKSTVVKFFATFIAIALRRTCLLLALINMMGLILMSCLQFSNFLDDCYCNASVLGRGKGSYIVVAYDGSINTMRTSRIIATILAGASMSIFMVFLWLMSALPSDPTEF
ncbi:hypothetical protein BJ322DRAFT_880426 [Thelephora terrestris]|uniref:Uncharacterized protein n=1 Tax=Thelephora terrestris TaxID=56493 RepID=A0A9P6L5R0_9AGAM|nr:hypothetical protein BJ322DRAFT_880426 [Thelephora terrestris]